MDQTEWQNILRKYCQYILFTFNLLFVITGIIILSVGLSVKAYYHEYSVFMENQYFYASDLLIIIGIIIFIIAFFGCCGALKENACMTMTFSSLLIVILVLELCVGIGGILLRTKAEKMIGDALNSTMNQYGKNNSEEITFLWDQIQTEFHCCGVNNYTDWTNLNNTHEWQVPITCCKIPDGTQTTFTCTKDILIKQNPLGCREVFGNTIKEHATSIQSVGLGLAIIQLLGIILSCYLSKQIKSDYETV